MLKCAARAHRDEETFRSIPLRTEFTLAIFKPYLFRGSAFGGWRSVWTCLAGAGEIRENQAASRRVQWLASHFLENG